MNNNRQDQANMLWWRAPDGALIQRPLKPNEGTADGVLVRPDSTEKPVFRLPFPIAPGEVVEVSLNVEAARCESDAGAEGQAGMVLTLLPESAKDQSNPSTEYRQIVLIGTQSETVRFAFRSQRAYENGALLLVPSLSVFGRAIALSNVRFTLHPVETDPDALTQPSRPYRGHEPDASWRTEAERRIDRYRKADLTVRIVDRWGRPVPDAEVRIEQIRHAYPFGTAVVASRLIDAPREYDPATVPDPVAARARFLEENQAYRQWLVENFNTVVMENDLKWPQWAGADRRAFRQEWALQAIDWLHERQFSIKGHCMVWGSWQFTPAWLREKEHDPAAIQAAVLAHIRDIGNATADRTRYWDVLNEPMSHRNVIELLGTKAVAEWFKTAREAMPGVRLVMNDFDLVGNGGNPVRRANFLAFYRDLRAHGAEIDVLGLQGHFWSDRFTAPEDVWRIIDEMHQASGLPLMISEFDTNFPNERMQADYLRDFLTAWFAHPATEAFIMWGFWGGAHWMGDTGALIRRDGTIKPAFYAYRDLVYRKWWTRDSIRTNADGIGQIRAFQGRHRIIVEGRDGREISRTIELPPEGRDITIVLVEN